MYGCKARLSPTVRVGIIPMKKRKKEATDRGAYQVKSVFPTDAID